MVLNSIKLIFIAGTIFFADNAISSPPSIDEYMSKQQKNQYDQYIYGLENGLDWAQEITFSKNAVEFFCKPGNLVLSAAQLRILIDKEIEENKSFYNKYKDAPLLGLALRNAYMSNFPCK